MNRPADAVLRTLRAHAEAAAARAHVPYTQTPEGALLLLSDGTYVPGVRVESATFSLLIPPLLGALTTATAAGRRDVVAAVMPRPLTADEALLVRQALDGPFDATADGTALRTTAALPPVGERLDPRLPGAPPADDAAGLRWAREVAERAHVPDSNFPVGCVLETTDGAFLPGVNVEHPDWARILCAERTVLSTALTYGLTPKRLYLTCLRDDNGSPCGACRQLLVEHAPGLPVVMDRGAAPPEHTTPGQLLPGAFSGDALTTPLA